VVLGLVLLPIGRPDVAHKQHRGPAASQLLGQSVRKDLLVELQVLRASGRPEALIKRPRIEGFESELREEPAEAGKVAAGRSARVHDERCLATVLRQKLQLSQQ